VTPRDLERYLHDHIPLSGAMQVSVVSLEAEAVVLEAPLAPNINHRRTVFGGSASALATLAAWSLLHTRLRDAGRPCRVVIQRNTMEYEVPIQGAFSARATLGPHEAWDRFLQVLDRKGKARLTLASTLASGGVEVGRFSGVFVALAAHPPGGSPA